MFRVVKVALFIVGVIAILYSCSGNEQKYEAENLFNKAVEEYEAGKYQCSESLLNVIDSVYCNQLDVRRNGMNLRPHVKEASALAELALIDSLLVENQIATGAMMRSMSSVGNVIERYVVHKGSPANINEIPGIYARMSPDAQLYIVAVTPGVKANSMGVVAAGGEITVNSLPWDGERCDRIGRNYVLTYLSGECIDFVKAIAAGANRVFFCNNGSKVGSLTLSSQSVEAITETYNLWTKTTERNILELRKAKCEKILQIARSQIARSMPDSSDTE